MNEKQNSVKKVVVDARVVVGNHGHGILRYTEELLRQLAQMDTDFEFVLLVNRGSPFLEINWPSHFRCLVLHTPWLSFLGQFELGFALRKLKPDVFHTPSFMVPLLSTVPMVATIHDLNHVVLAENYSVFHRLYYSLILSRKMKKAKAIITVSQFSRDEILRYFSMQPEVVHVIYNGIGTEFQNASAVSEQVRLQFRERFELPESYILTIGNKKPHKNILRTVEAYCLGDFSLPLVVLSDFDPDILRIASRYRKKHLIHFLRYVGAKEFPLVYAQARVFVYPSLYEGFGLPPLESAACGTPAVVSRNASLPEVMRDGALYVDPEDPEDIARGISLALQRNGEVDRAVVRGKEISREFQWSRVAEQTLSVYRKVVGQGAHA